MSCVRWVMWDELCEMSCVRWVVWDELCQDELCDMSCVRLVVWDELCERSCVRWVVGGELWEISCVSETWRETSRSSSRAEAAKRRSRATERGQRPARQTWRETSRSSGRAATAEVVWDESCQMRQRPGSLSAAPATHQQHPVHRVPAPATQKGARSRGDRWPQAAPRLSKCCTCHAKAASGAPSAAPATQKGARSRGDRWPQAAPRLSKCCACHAKGCVVPRRPLTTGSVQAL